MNEFMDWPRTTPPRPETERIRMFENAQDPHATSPSERIRRLLDEHHCPHRHLRHEPTPTSEDSARVRGEPLEVGGKALVLKVDASFIVLVLSAARKLDSKRLRTSLGARKVRFATREELLDRTGLVPGSVPPFGEPLFPLALVVDQSVLDNERIAFNAGSLEESIIMSVEDWRRCAAPTRVVDATVEPEGS
ncbi:MAG: YbaK/EbsC family protein [Planctomycetota bacterium]|nr:YbaK/EbsC family protein [Planctomycetota bacterium]